jgi:hypothetical protein
MEAQHIKTYECSKSKRGKFIAINTSEKERRLGLVAQTCNHRYLGGIDQEDYSLRPAQAKS